MKRSKPLENQHHKITEFKHNATALGVRFGAYIGFPALVLFKTAQIILSLSNGDIGIETFENALSLGEDISMIGGGVAGAGICANQIKHGMCEIK